MKIITAKWQHINTLIQQKITDKIGSSVIIITIIIFDMA